jgi:hypothetical protein
MTTSARTFTPLHRTLQILALIFTAALLTAPLCQADTNVVSVAPQVIEVTGNGNTYTDAELFNGLQIKLRIRDLWTVVRPLVRQVDLWPLIENPYLELDGFAHRYTQYYPVGARVLHLDSTPTIVIPNTDAQSWAVRSCNLDAERRRRQGEGNRSIFASDHTLPVKVRSRAQIQRIIIRHEVGDTEINMLSVVCKAWAGVAIPPVGGIIPRPPPKKVESVQLMSQIVAGHSGVCRLTLRYVLRTSIPDMEVKFILKDDKGRSSEVKTLYSNAIRLAGGSVTYDIPNNVGAEIGTIRMHGVSPEFISNPVEYRVVCREPGAGGLSWGAPAPQSRNRPPVFRQDWFYPGSRLRRSQ